MEELDVYPWSGHRSIIGKSKHLWTDAEYVLSQFGNTRRKGLTGYRKFMSEGASLGKQPELSGGGLLRSLGGWSQVVSKRRRGEQEEGDERILGSGDFVQAILQEAGGIGLRQLKLKRSGKSIRDIVEEECKKAGLSPMEVMSGVRRREVSRLRAVIALRGRIDLGLSSAEMARYLGVAASSISRLVADIEKNDNKAKG